MSSTTVAGSASELEPVSQVWMDRRPSRMLRGYRKRWGRRGEKEVADNVPCPKCGGRLISMPADYPVIDLVCSGCDFAPQVKSITGRPKRTIPGSNYRALEKWREEGKAIPPLIVNSKWNGSQDITLFENVPEDHIRIRQRKGKRVYSFVHLEKLTPRTLLRSESGLHVRGEEVRQLGVPDLVVNPNGFFALERQ